jgi:hypothetical protein
MKLRTFPMAVILFLALVLALPQGASAEAVGHLTQVQGRVDLLKGGKLPANPVKVGDAVAEGDVLRAKSLSKAQITFVDNTTLTMSPESRIAIEKYMFDPAKGKRSAVVQLFQGMVLAVVSKIYQTEQPDFVVKTHTAIMGIRGTEVGIRLAPNSSQFLNFQGLTRVCSNFPEIPGCVNLKTMEATEVLFGKTPMMKYEIFHEDQKFFMNQMNVAALKPQAQGAVCSAGSPANACAPGATVATGASAATSAGAGVGSGSSNSAASSGGSFTGGGGAVIVVPQLTQVTQVVQQPTLQTFTFTQTYSSLTYQMTSNQNPVVINQTTFPAYTVATYLNLTSGSGTRTGVYLGSFTSSFNIVATATTGTFATYSTGTFSVPNTNTLNNATFTVSGIPGQQLSGTMTMYANTGGGTVFSLSGPVTLQPNGKLDFTTNGTLAVGGTKGTTTGTWTQVAK